MENKKELSDIKRGFVDLMGRVAALSEKETDFRDKQMLAIVSFSLEAAYKTLIAAENILVPARALRKSIEKPKKSVEKINYSAIQKLYNECCPSLPRCLSLSDARKKAIKARFSDGNGEEVFHKVFVKAEASGFLRGENDRRWTANFDWLIKATNFSKVLEGVYDDREKNSGNVFMDMMREENLL